MARNTYPFGPDSRSTNDLGTQYVPFFTHLWDLLHGRAQGDFFFNWQSAYGVGFLADFGVVLGSPLSLLVGLFPRDRIDLAVFVITALKLALAAAAMAAYLVRMRRGPRWLAAVLGASYGLCGWAIDDGAYVPMWLDGLIALPLFCLVAEWTVQSLTPPRHPGQARRKHLILSVAVVALFWVSNFYTAYMATIAGGLVLLARILTSDLSWLNRLRALIRYGVTVALGIAASAPVLLPVFQANGAAAPSPPGIFSPVPVENFIARLFPLSEGVGRSASLYVGTAALVLALSLPFNGSVKARTRVVWTLMVVLVGASFLWEPTHVVWNGFDTPNGSQYRQAFVLCAILVIAAWLSVADRTPSWIALTGGVALLVGLALYAQDNPLLTSHSLQLLALSAAGVVVVMLMLRYLRRYRTIALLAGVALIAAVGAELTLSAVVVDEQRSKVLSAPAVPWGRHQQALADSVEAAAGWPKYRVDPGTSTTPNDPVLLGGQGAGYYSSLLPETLNHTLTGLGFGWSGYGRASYELQNPVTDAIFSVGATIGPYAGITRADVPPLVTVRPKPLPDAPKDSTAYDMQERLLGADVYDIPVYKAKRAADGVFTLQASCRPGLTVYLYLPRVDGEARFNTANWMPLAAARRPGINTSSAMVQLGKVPASGLIAAELKVKAAPNNFLYQGAMGCLDSARLTKAVAALQANGAVAVQAGGHSIHATLKPGTTGVAVIAAPHLPGWRCSTDNGQLKEASNYGGLLAVELPGPTRKVSCDYRPPGLELGLAAAGGAGLVTLLLALASLLWRRRRQAS
ncbi:YfhO family protein [Kribbella sancticallisti]|uniref:YfhO family protein n=2 Tax=Kribbella sancticallisti TaxID=460087 RepID=A0ABN2E255_9ACTN